MPTWTCWTAWCSGHACLIWVLCRADFKKQLGRLNRELLFGYLDLLDCLVQRPSAYARAVENVGVGARNMAYLLNALRAHQVITYY